MQHDEVIPLGPQEPQELIVELLDLRHPGCEHEGGRLADGRVCGRVLQQVLASQHHEAAHGLGQLWLVGLELVGRAERGTLELAPPAAVAEVVVQEAGLDVEPLVLPHRDRGRPGVPLVARRGRPLQKVVPDVGLQSGGHD